MRWTRKNDSRIDSSCPPHKEPLISCELVDSGQVTGRNLDDFDLILPTLVNVGKIKGCEL